MLAQILLQFHNSSRTTLSSMSIDQSSLSLDDLLPANPIVKHMSETGSETQAQPLTYPLQLVDELIIEFPNRVSRCIQTFQRQLLSAQLLVSTAV
ncbi:hypothetical protein DFH29DRAFT_572102 [Suillus ampliporus]|nr:hypothetical protein DFH29DRAFT_572102 [Suillus ampliporus]